VFEPEGGALGDVAALGVGPAHGGADRQPEQAHGEGGTPGGATGPGHDGRALRGDEGADGDPARDDRRARGAFIGPPRGPGVKRARGAGGLGFALGVW
jgi:hypothetical protein